MKSRCGSLQGDSLLKGGPQHPCTETAAQGTWGLGAGLGRGHRLVIPCPHPPLWLLTGSASLCRGESEAEMGRSSWAPGLPGGLLHIGAGCVSQEPKDAGPAQPLGLAVGCPWSCSEELTPQSCQGPPGPHPSLRSGDKGASFLWILRARRPTYRGSRLNVRTWPNRKRQCWEGGRRRALVQPTDPRGFPGGSDGKESACKVGDPGSIPGWEQTFWSRAWQPTPVFLPGEPHGQRSLAAYSPWGCKESHN